MGATAANVDTVMVDGRILKRSGKLVDCDVAEVVEQAKRSAMRIRTTAGGILAPQCPGCAGNAVFRATAC
jgi:hypothetical protein